LSKKEEMTRLGSFGYTMIGIGVGYLTSLGITLSMALVLAVIPVALGCIAFAVRKLELGLACSALGLGVAASETHGVFAAGWALFSGITGVACLLLDIRRSDIRASK
jgi:hypothetical protein